MTTQTMYFKKHISVTVLIGAAMTLALAPLYASAANAELKNGASFCKDFKGAECIDEPNGADGQINSVKYRQHGDGSGAVIASPLMDINSRNTDAFWEIGCRKDVISGAKICTISFQNIRVSIDPQGRQRVWLSGADETYPGTRERIRIGNKVFSTGADEIFPNAKAITSAMVDGIELATEYKGWPYNNSVSAVTPQLYGFQEALKLATWTVKNLR